MKSRVLYFPYIRVPDTRWLTQMLLYWDQVSSIVPSEHIYKPESLGPYMLSLVREELVYQVIPGEHIHTIESFTERFMSYLESLGPEADHRRERFARHDVFRVHIEKMADIGDALVSLRLARPGQYPWYDVQTDTAHDFMSYLATVLGQIESIDSSPVTDDDTYLQRLARAGVPSTDMTKQLDALRIQVLDHILPVPNGAITPTAIRAFKERYRRALNSFRFGVEKELVDALNITNPELRQRHLEIFFDRVKQEIETIEQAMKGEGWNIARAALSVISAIPGVSPLLGLVGAVWGAIAGGGDRQVSHEFAYAAHARAKLGAA